MKRFEIVDIEWETDGQVVALPVSAVVECDDEEAITDVLADRYGWLVSGYTIKGVKSI